jgi:hypothetical protein
MRTRDRLFLMVIAAAAILVAGWMMFVSPEHKKAASLGTQVSQARQSLNDAQTKLAAARAAQAQYPTAYASVVELGKAVPPGDEVASLVYQLAQASNSKSVDFNSITAGGGAAGATTAAPAAAPSPVGAAGFQAMPFTFKFNGSFFSLYHLLNRLNGFTLQTTNGNVQVSGRLLTINDANLDVSQASTASGPSTSTGELSGTITATAYVLPANEGLTGGATPASPTAAGAPASPPAGASAPSSPAPAAAVARVTP